MELVKDLTDRESGALRIQVLSEFHWILTRKPS